jgi:hypothetical protein
MPLAFDGPRQPFGDRLGILVRPDRECADFG